jgi:hypothetical protein
MDRMTKIQATTWRFTERQHDDPAAYVQRSVASAAYRFRARIVVHAPLREVQEPAEPRTALAQMGGRAMRAAGVS